MGEHIDKLAALHTPQEKAEAYVALARVVRTMEGSKRFRVPLGTVIQNRPKELKKLNAPTTIDGVTGRVKQKGKTGEENHKLFSMRVEELKKSIEKLDKAAIKNLLQQLEDAKNLPKSANYIKIRDMLRSYLKDKKNDSSVDKGKGSK